MVLLCLSTTTLLAKESSQSRSSEAGDLSDPVVVRKYDLPYVVYEADHSLSLTKLDVGKLHNVLNSGDGVVVNFDVEFAANTSVMTAEGNHTIDVLLRTLKYIRPATHYEIQVHGESGQSSRRRSVAATRAQTVLHRLDVRFGHRHKFSLSEAAARPKRRKAVSSSERVEVWSFSLAGTLIKTEE